MGNNADDKGGTSMREHNILTAPVEFLDILELQRGRSQPAWEDGSVRTYHR